MNLAIQHLQRKISETEAKLSHAKDAHSIHERTVAESAANVAQLAALLVDLKAAVAALPVAALKAVESPSGVFVPATKAKKR